MKSFQRTIGLFSNPIFSCKLKNILLWILLSILILPSAFAQSGWELMEPIPGLQNITLQSITFANPSIGFAVGDEGTILKTTDGGINWILQDEVTDKDLNSVFLLNADTGFIVGWGGIFLKTTNSGNDWTVNYPVYTNLYSVFFTDSNNGHATGSNGKILKTTDGAENWVVLGMGVHTNYDIYFTDHYNGYLSGTGGSIYKTTDAGLTWISHASGASTSIVEFFFTDSNIGYSLKGGYSFRIQKTIDAGLNWITLETGDTYGTRSIFFTNDSTGYISGSHYQSDTCLILKTTNGGNDWIDQSPAIPDGRMQSVYFTDELTGIAVGRKGQIIRTFTGGEYIDPMVDTLILHSLMDISGASNCILPYFSEIYVNAVVSGSSFQIGDSIEYQMFFGDGYNTTLYRTIQEDLPTDLPCTVEHVYLFPGAYNLMCIATLPNGLSDTLEAEDILYISDNCGSIGGTIFLDENEDCIPDEEEYKIPNIPARLYHNDQYYAIDYTGEDGNYSFDIPEIPGFYIEIDTADIPDYNILCPDGPIHIIENVPSDSLHYALTCESGFDFDAFVAGSGFRPGEQGQLLMNIENHSCYPNDGWIKLVLDPLTSYLNAIPQPDQIIGDTLKWNFSDLSNLEDLLIPVSLYTGTNAWVGDSVCFDVYVYPIEGDNDTTNNIQQYCFPIENSYDPNMKEVYPEGEITGDTTLKYTLHFQNTGNAEAYNISIVDTINSNLDMNLFQLLSYSHPINMEIMNQEINTIIKFNFNDIMLPDSGTNYLQSMGYVSFEIQPNLDLANGTIINNTAYIFFDYNPAVATNTVVNTIHISNITNYIDENSIILYPNPTTGSIHISTEKDMDITVFNMLGQKLFFGNTRTTNTLEILEKSIYLIEFSNTSFRIFKKVIVQ